VCIFNVYVAFAQILIKTLYLLYYLTTHVSKVRVYFKPKAAVNDYRNMQIAIFER
jgi:hypothetical protein